MTETNEWYIETPVDFSLYETVHAHGWRHLQPFDWNEEERKLNRIERISAGKVVLISVVEASERRLFIQASDLAPEVDILSTVRAMLQLHIAIGDFHSFCRERTELSHILARNCGRMLCSPTLWEDTVKVIATSNTTWAQTQGMVARLCEHFGSALPSDPGRHAFPAPEQVAAHPFSEFAAAARMGYRNDFVYKLAASIVGGGLDLEAWKTDTDTADNLRKNLLSLPGIGPYGAACLLLYCGQWGHVNVDSWARTRVARELGRPVTDKDVQNFFENYGDWRGLVYTFYPWRH